MEDRKILDYMEEHLDPLLLMLRTFVELESPSHEDKAASDKCGQYLYDRFGELGFSMEKIAQSTCGDHVYGELGTG